MSAHWLIRSTSLLALGSLALVGLGCGRTTRAPEPAASSVTPTEASGDVRGETDGRDAGRAPVLPGSAAPVARGACDHPYYPLRAGYEIRYRSSFPAVAGVSSGGYGLRVTAADGNTATLTASFDSSVPDQPPITSEQIIECRGGGLHARSYIDFGSRVSGGSAANQFKVTTLDSSGEMLPADMRVGSEWRGAFNIRMAAVRPGPDSPLPRPIDVTVSINRRATAEETVRVPAGEYRALKVAATTDLGMGSPISGTEWWVEGVGMVKSEYSFGGAGAGNFITEATSVTVPR